ncbi:MAG: SUMF1/EgtB/PvdO family nonheme iron enzyme [Rhizonema sp. PD38]|nr:SUMF1/EgtB/PvdO family nonheme iron enzyme [Rhizonema sp. PD38]
MTIPDELITIFDRILDGNRDEKDINLLRQNLLAVNGQNQVQLAKYITNTPSVKELHLGDRTYYGTDAETIKAALREILPEIIYSIGIEKLPQENALISRPPNFSPQTISEKFVEASNSQTQRLPPVPTPAITIFEFEQVSVDAQGREIKFCGKQAEYFVENLGNSVLLSMVSIPGGKFQMGASVDESESLEDERPQHLVTIKPFFMGKYPITQAEWRAIATLPKIKHHLNPDPSYFKGDNLPVERVSWHDAHEFCERLSRETGRQYRLPSEAEWEYACRARTSTPFHFGKRITTNLANYCGQNENIKGVHRQQTTEVGSFPANAFGLCDLHGLVWEWCADYEHEDYQDAPSDGSSWLCDGNSEYRILRGGSWDSFSRFCRSASRFSSDANIIDKEFGFRVVCC